MRKYVGYIIMIVSTLMLINLMSSDNASVSYVECMAEEAACLQVTRDRVEHEELLKGLYFDEQELFYDVNEKNFYYSLIEGSSTAYKPEVKLKSPVEGVKVLFLGEITKEGIERNEAIPILAYSDEYYYIYHLKCTTLPLMNIKVDGLLEMTKTKNTDKIMEMTLFDNQQGAAQRLINSAGSIRIRGGSTANLAKKSYRISLTMESLGENTRANQISLLGMRQDDDWLLYAPYNDQEKVRNVFNMNLWTQTCGMRNYKGVQTGIEYKYLELFVNGAYAGLYALGYPMDEKALGIDKMANENLYKKVYYGNISEFAYHKNTRDEEFVNGYDVKTIESMDENDIYERWRVLLTYYQNVAGSVDDNQMLLRMIDIENAIDLYLFLGLIQGVDNVQEGQIKNMYMLIREDDGMLKMTYAPWDMDLTWGNTYCSEQEENYVYPYRITAEKNICASFGPFNQLLLNGTTDIMEQIFVRYRELRAGGWSDEKITELLDAYEADIYDSGAYRRELKRWPKSTQANPEDKLSVFKQYVLERLHIVDEYYLELEKGYKSGEYELNLSEGYAFSANPKGCGDLKLYLTLLAFGEYEVCIEVKDNSIWEDSYYVKLFENIGVETDAIPVKPELEADVHIILIERKTMQIADDVYFAL